MEKNPEGTGRVNGRAQETAKCGGPSGLLLEESSALRRRRLQGETTSHQTVVGDGVRCLNDTVGRLIVTPCDDEVQSVAFAVCPPLDNLYQAKRRQNIEETLRVLVAFVVDMQIEVPANHCVTSIRQHRLQQASQFFEELSEVIATGLRRPVDDNIPA